MVVSRWRWLLIVVAMPLLGLGGWLISRQITAWNELRAGQAELERNLPERARPRLDRCLAVWPDSAQVQFLAGQAARRTGDLAAARRHLDRAEQLGWVGEAIELERGLWRVQTGDTAPSETLLKYCQDHDGPETLLVLEILTPAFMRSFQLFPSQACVDRWKILAPEDARPWNYQGILAERRHNAREAREAYAESVRLDPGRVNVRLALIRTLLDANQADQAEENLEILLRDHPDDFEGRLYRARALMLKGNRDDARGLLDALLVQRPNHLQVLSLRGQIDLDSNLPDKAEPFLRRAASLPNGDIDVLYNWLRCLRLVGKPEEIKQVEQRWKQFTADSEQMKDLMRKIAENPSDCALRRKAGELSLRNNQEEEGLRWLQSALAVQPDDANTHRLLAEYYAKKGYGTLANQHQIAAQSASKK